MAKLNLKELSSMVNIAEEADLSKEQLTDIGQRVLAGFNEDMNSSMPWLNDVRRVTELASLISKKKSKPLPNSANIKFPIITKACYEFSSQTYPEIIKDDKVVKYRTIGKDNTQGSKEAQGKRTTDYMNYQLLFKNTEWENDLDGLLNQLPLIGFLCKKQYYNPTTDEIESIMCHYEDLIVHEKIKSLKTADRISHIQPISLNELISNVRAGVFLKDPIDELIARMQEMTIKPEIKIVEQHTFLDLDDDDYEEPYIITILQDSGKVLRIAPRFESEDIELNEKKEVKRIKATQHFKDYHFLKSPKGTFRGVGFGILLLHLNETVNSLLNMLVDAGQLANMQGGYVDSSFKMIESGDNQFDPGQFKKMKVPEEKSLKDGVFPIIYKEPSQVLHALLGILIEASKDLSSSTEVMTGNSSPENSKTGATMALIQQGQKLANSIQKRFYRSLTDEFQGIFELNYKYLDNDVYVEVLGDELAVSRQDFDCEVVRIIPMADPNLASEAKRSNGIQILMALLQVPGVDPIKVGQRIVKLAPVDNSDELLQDPNKQQAPNPEIIKIQADIEEKAQLINLKQKELELEEKKFQLDGLEKQSVIILNRAKALQAVALADQAQATTQYTGFKQQLDGLQAQLDHFLGVAQLQQQDQHHQDEMAQNQQQMQQDQGQHEDNTDLQQQQVDQNAEQSQDVAPGSGDASSS